MWGWVFDASALPQGWRGGWAVKLVLNNMFYIIIHSIHIYHVINIYIAAYKSAQFSLIHSKQYITFYLNLYIICFITNYIIMFYIAYIICYIFYKGTWYISVGIRMRQSMLNTMLNLKWNNMLYILLPCNNTMLHKSIYKCTI